VNDVAKAASIAEIKDIGIEFCKDQVRGLLKSGVPGVHFYSEGRAEQITKVIEATF
jgi:methylenetetrahydrofolate reductase (NADPH)